MLIVRKIENMRIPPKDIHPTLWAAFDEYEKRLYSMQLDADTMSAAGKHQTEWFKEYGRGFALWGALWILGTFGMAWVGKQLGLGPTLMFVGIAGAGIHAWVATQKNRRTASVKELEALLPILKLDEMGRLYAETLLQVFQSKLPEEARAEAISELNRLMSEHEHLKAGREKIESALSSTQVEEIQRDIERLERKVGETTDPEAKLGFEQSLSIARQRMETAQRFHPYIQRIDAQIELVKQALLNLKSDLGRLALSPTVLEISPIDGLRRSTLSIRSQADEIERAILELNSSL